MWTPASAVRPSVNYETTSTASLGPTHTTKRGGHDPTTTRNPRRHRPSPSRGTQAALEGADPRTNPWPIDSTDERLAFLNWCWRQGYSAVIVETMDAVGAYEHLNDNQAQ